MIQFYRCQHCGNIVMKLHDSKVAVVCCNESMIELHPNTIEAAVEKHIPVIKKLEQGTEISVGSILHPMTEEHYIEWIYVETLDGGVIEYFTKTKEPRVIVNMQVQEIKTVYAYCNLHGLWQMK